MSIIYSWDILLLSFKKSLDLDLKSLRLNLWYIRLELEKSFNYLTGLGFILQYIGVRLEKKLD